jgi:gp16 family phage-associated protein
MQITSLHESPKSTQIATFLHSMSKKQALLKTRCLKALDDLHTAGVSVSQWARDNGYSRDVVASVVYGRSACLRGQAHEVAVALGIKTGYVVKPGTYKPKVSPVNANQGTPS